MRRYFLILRTPRTLRMVVAMFVGRLPNGMFPLGIVFVLRQSSGSYSVAGTALAALMFGTTCSAPLRGRAVDRWGQPHTLIPLVVAQAVAMTGLLFAVHGRASALVVIPLVAALGALSSTLGGSMRQLWPSLLAEDELPTAYALQALLEDLIAVTGPLIAAALLVIASPTTILAFAELAALAGTTVFATSAPSRAAKGRTAATSRFLGALGTPGMRTLVITLLAAGMTIGMLYIAVPAFTNAAGVLLAVMAFSSMAGGLAYGARTWTWKADRRYLWLAGLFAAVAAPLSAARTTTQLAILLVFVGLAYAPRMISAYLLLDELAPPDSLTEAYTWLVSATAAGTALGSAIAGPLAQHANPHWTLAAAGLPALAGYALTAARRRSLNSSSMA